MVDYTAQPSIGPYQHPTEVVWYCDADDIPCKFELGHRIGGLVADLVAPSSSSAFTFSLTT